MTKKSKEDFIVPVKFKVLDAHYSTEVRYDSNGVFGPGASSWIAGIIPYLKLEVEPVSERHQGIRFIEFPGLATIEKDDNILAYIPKYEKRTGESTGMLITRRDQNETPYTERDFKETEKVSKIEKLSKDHFKSVAATFETQDSL